MNSSKMSPDTIDYQKQLADYCRSGNIEKGHLPGITPNRLHHYRRLVSNVIYDTLERAYPITCKLLSDEQWENAVEDFFTNHDCQEPQVWKMPKDFSLFLKEHNYPKKLNKPYLDDLLHFEWIEVELYCMQDMQPPKHSDIEDYQKDIFVFNPEHHILGLKYPVHLTVDDNELSKEGNYFVLAYRDYDERDVHFINLGCIPAVCTSLMIEEHICLNDAIQKAESVLDVQIPEEQVINLINIFKNLEEQGVVLGAR